MDPIWTFDQYFQDVHGLKPFPWQIRLADWVLSQGWPPILALPTAAGKTAVLDVAVFALALSVREKRIPRTAPRRIALVVDRRIVVDDAHRRAQKISQAVKEAQTPLLKQMREALCALGGETPLEAALLRGGIYREDRWARTPAQPVLLCSTVDQVGSRLLFRGYGLSPSQWPIHAGLLGNDTLIILDEAHCSRPFLQTLRHVAAHRERSEKPLGLPFAVTAMTATPPASESEEPFRLDGADRACEVLCRRLTASKRVTVEASKIPSAKGKTTPEVESGDREEKALVEACLRHLQGAPKKNLGLAQPGKTVLVVLNRVASARRLREELRTLEEKWPHQALLLTGRSRPVERDALLDTFRERLMAGRDRKAQEGAPPLVVVATQCVEVGADLDVDALITEACPLDALRQRLGRLDRLGHLGTTPAVLLYRPSSKTKDDPIYGKALKNTVTWLEDMQKQRGASDGTIDLGTDALDKLLAALELRENSQTPTPPETEQREEGDPAPAQPEASQQKKSEDGNPVADPPKAEEAPGAAKTPLLPSLNTPAPDAPVLLPTYCDLWCQTGPVPTLSPDPALFLHGPATGTPDVSLVWRSDLPPERPESWEDIVALCPPVAGEMLSLPLWQARAWLDGEKATSPEVSDLEGAKEAPSPGKKRGASSPETGSPEGEGPEGEESEEEPEDLELPEAEPEETRPPKRGKMSLRWFGGEGEILTGGADLRPGDVLLLPASVGGCDAEGWNPESERAADLGDEARFRAKRPAVLRLHPSLKAAWKDAWSVVEPLAASGPAGTGEDELEERVASLLKDLASRNDLPGELQEAVRILENDPKRRMDPHPSGVGLVLSSRERLGKGEDFSDEGPASHLARGGAVTLANHHGDVEREARRSGGALPEALREDVAWAGAHHDLGKADPRFQIWLAGGDRLRNGESLLAKSRALAGSSRAREEARKISGYPRGGRHEFLSLALAESCPDLEREGGDEDLVRHLIASHHGHCRPFAPVVEDPRAPEVSLHWKGKTLRASGAPALHRLESGVAARFWQLVRRYGWWGLAYLEACLRLADHRASENPSTTQED